MIQNREERKSNTHGFSQQSAISIPESSVNYIVELLSSNLYTTPIKSFLRENIANALDANTENNKSSDPVIVDVDTVMTYVEIEDHGIGINPQRFQDIYLKLGSSTKRNSNEQIGSFGLGRLSALACSNNIFIDTVYYDSSISKYIRDVYNMYKPNLGINIEHIIHEELEQTPSTTGTKVRVYLPLMFYEMRNIRESIITTFPILYANGKIILKVPESYRYLTVNGFNLNYKEFNNYYIVDLANHTEFNYLKNPVFVGDLLYSGDDTHNFVVSTVYQQPEDPDIKSTAYQRANVDLQIIPKLKIGEVNFTPSRDNIKFDQKTTNSLQEIYSQVFVDLLKNNAMQHFTDLGFLYTDCILKQFVIHSDFRLINIPKDYNMSIKDAIDKGYMYFTFSTTTQRPAIITTNKAKCTLVNLCKDKNVHIRLLDMLEIFNYVICEGAKLVITNRVMNEIFCKEKLNLTEPAIYVPFILFKRLSNEERAKTSQLLKDIIKHTAPGTVAFESVRAYGNIKNVKVKRDSTILKVKKITTSSISLNETYYTKTEDWHITIQDTEDYPMVVASNQNEYAVKMLRYIYFFRCRITNYVDSLFPKEMKLLTCSNTVLTKLTTEGKAIDIYQYMALNNLTVNIIKLVNLKYRTLVQLAHEYGNSYKMFLYEKGVDPKTIANFEMLMNIIKFVQPLQSEDRSILEGFGTTIDYSKFGKTLPILKDSLYNIDIIRMPTHILHKYFIPKYTKFTK